MKAKEKALYLADKFPCAAIAEDCIDEILKVVQPSENLGVTNTTVSKEYWQKVKEEIIKLR